VVGGSHVRRSIRLPDAHGKYTLRGFNHRLMALRIVRYNDPVLRKKGEPVKVFDSALALLSEQMVATMHTASGIGLAAQQIGRAIQFCVVDLRAAERDFSWELDGSTPPLELFMPLSLANPVVSVIPSEKTVYEEGCLSFPDIRGDVIRTDAIKVTFQDLQGVSHTLLCDGLLSRCIQHEVDHLNGTLFIDRMEKKVRAKIEKPIKELAQQTKDESDAAGA
jgi:peptide deformylase